MAGPVTTIPVTPRKRRRNLAQGTYSTAGEKLVHTYYDTQLIQSASVAPMHFFQAAQGQPLNGVGAALKTLQHTNMTMGGQIPRGQRFTIYCIKLMYTAITLLADASILGWYNMLANCTFEFLISGKDSLLTLTLQELLGASTLILPAPAVGSGYSTVNRIILPRFHGNFPLSTAIVLSEQTNFECRVIPQVVTPTTVLTGDFLKIGLSGVLERLS